MPENASYEEAAKIIFGGQAAFFKESKNRPKI